MSDSHVNACFVGFFSSPASADIDVVRRFGYTVAVKFWWLVDGTMDAKDELAEAVINLHAEAGNYATMRLAYLDGDPDHQTDEAAAYLDERRDDVKRLAAEALDLLPDLTSYPAAVLFVQYVYARVMAEEAYDATSGTPVTRREIAEFADWLDAWPLHKTIVEIRDYERPADRQKMTTAEKRKALTPRQLQSRNQAIREAVHGDRKSLSEVAVTYGLSNPQVSRIVNGKTKN